MTGWSLGSNMHDVIENGFEDYLTGNGSRDFHSHLSECVKCREAVGDMRRISGFIVALRVEQTGALGTEQPQEPAVVPSLGFSSRVIRDIREQKSRSFWNLLVMDSAFTRKVALGSLLGFAALASFLIASTDSLAQDDKTPEAIITSHDVYSSNEQQHLDGMLVTLATYRQ
jgi:hypothetical protein